MLRVRDVVDILEDLAPRAFALRDDPVGLQVGRPDKPVRRLLVALEVDRRVLAEADAAGPTFSSSTTRRSSAR
ncbi:MAG: Nif3-like dinuclear metal center hexameric protein [Brockia lithotrophica]|nr:Nif3-like dinuclear metal center hexameric protein [Brockia lithotrophica]